MIEFRKAEPTVRRESFLHGTADEPGELPDVSWFGSDGKAIDWTEDDAALVCLLRASPSQDDPAAAGRHVLILVNGGPQPRDFVLPPVARSQQWRLLLDTGEPSPGDIFSEGDGPPLSSRRKLTLQDRSLVCYVAEQTAARRRKAGGA